MKFCSECAHELIRKIPKDDNALRDVCPACGSIFYENPIPVLCTIPVWGESGNTKILLCKRAIEPRYGFWTLPGGFMEIGETTSEGAIRETREEVGANIELLPLFAIINIPSARQVHFFYRARLLDTNFNPGAESLEVRLFSESEIPWNEIAFRTTKLALQTFFEESKRAKNGVSFGFYEKNITTKGFSVP